MSTQVSMCLSASHLWCDFSVKDASVKCCSFPMLSSLRASFVWTLGCLNRWQHREPNQPYNPLLGLPPCFYRSTWRICCTTMPCGSLDIREAGFSSLSKLDRIWKVCLSVCPGTDYCTSLYSHHIQVTLFCLQTIQKAAFFFRFLHCPNVASLHMLSYYFKFRNVISYYISLFLILNKKFVM